MGQDQHAEIVDALRRRDPDLAEAATRRHIENAKQNVLTSLASRRETGTGHDDRPYAGG
jgi:DNA-binding GntR family transcriptional regulator